jgi:transcriptional regulator with XRE-family HTH domain
MVPINLTRLFRIAIQTQVPARRSDRRTGQSDRPASTEGTFFAEVAGDIGPTYGEWLGAQLRARKMTQRLLAQRTGVDHSTISRILSGERNPTLRTATTLVRGLNAEFESGVLVPRNASAIARVEYALRSDEMLSEDQVGTIMRSYLALRTRDGNGSPRS